MTTRVIRLRVTEAEAELLQQRADMELDSIAEWGKRTLVKLAAGATRVVVDHAHPDNKLEEFPRL